jgi:alpha-amylase
MGMPRLASALAVPAWAACLCHGCSAADSRGLPARASDGASEGAVESAFEGGTDGTPDAGASQDAGVAPLGRAFVHLFEWRWTDVAKECALFLGPKGFAAVQVSPPSEHAILAGYPWWQRYQTVDYALDRSRSGTREEFAAMVQACAAAGVDVYVDAVINHMTAQTTGTGSNGTRYQKYAYTGLYDANDFHQPTCQIVQSDYTDSADHVRRCELDGLADLDTGADRVRSAIAGYLIALVEIGVRGFRIDAAKHISPDDLDAILGKVADGTRDRPPPYSFFEVIDPGGEAVHATDYLGVGAAAGETVGVTEFKYGPAVGGAFLGGGAEKLALLSDLGSPAWGLLPSGRAVAFTNNHDTQRAAAIFYQDAPYYDLANVFLLAWPYGYPSIMSGYAFDRSTQQGRDQGPPSDGQGNTTPVYGAGDAPSCAPVPASAPPGTWTCEHRSRSVANMVAFRRATASAPTVSNWWTDGSNQIAFGRGDRGFVVINREDSALSRTFQTGLRPGSYCDVVGGDFVGGACTGTSIAVGTDGSAAITVPANHAVAIHAEAVSPSP